MDTRTLGYIGLGVLVGIVVAALVGIPPFIWITTVVVTLVVTAAMALGLVAGHGDAARVLARETSGPRVNGTPSEPHAVGASDVEMELVRPSDEEAGTPAVWLHRRGGRRAHRYQTSAGWVVERVSTKDPDDARKRIIGEPLLLAGEAEAVAAADDLARGQTPTVRVPSRPSLTPAKA